jgi:hypothetical protein
MFGLIFKRILENKSLLKSSRLDTDSVHDPKLTWASGESETKGKAGKES